MKLELGYGNKYLEFELNENDLLGILKPNVHLMEEINEEEEIRNALENPIGTKKLREIIQPGEKIVIVTSDITRPMPTARVLPIVLEELIKNNVKYDDITVIFALGSHRGHSIEEKIKLVGKEIYDQIKCIDSDVSDYVNVGVTSNGTQVEIFTEVVEADRIICLGNIEYHYFAGYSGGAKAIMPGVSTRKAIQSNHSMMVREQAKTGEILDNPVRLDLEEAIKFIPIDFILNVVLSENKKVIKAVAGHYIDAHRVGCKFLDSIYKIKINQLADIVIVSPGGSPKDMNMYQAQKALDNAKYAVREGGIIIWVASCKEGLGESVFEKWVNAAKTSGEMVERIKTDFELGGHKAAAIGMILSKCSVYLVSDLEDQLVKKVFVEPFQDIESALLDAYMKMPPNPKIFVMPYGGSTLPSLQIE